MEGRLNHLKNASTTKNRRRGRRPLPLERKRRVHITVRLRWDEYEALQRMARAVGKSVSAYIRRLVYEAELEKFKAPLQRTRLEEVEP